MRMLSPLTPEWAWSRRNLSPDAVMGDVFDDFDRIVHSFLRKWLPRNIYHSLMYYSLPRVFRWGEDDHYYTDAEYERNELLKERTDDDRCKNLHPIKRLSRRESSDQNFHTENAGA